MRSCTQVTKTCSCTHNKHMQCFFKTLNSINGNTDAAAIGKTKVAADM